MNYANIKHHDIANGEGIRVSLFVSGCTHRCKDCFNQETWDFSYGKFFDEQAENEIIQALSPSYISGLTLLGGEPMEVSNQKSLLSLLQKVKSIYPNKTIWCYTGYLFEDFQNPYNALDSQKIKPDFLNNLPKKTNKARCCVTDEILSLIDVMVDGKFVSALKDISLRFKGSSNQRIIDVEQSLKQNQIILSPYNEKNNIK